MVKCLLVATLIASIIFLIINMYKITGTDTLGAVLSILMCKSGETNIMKHGHHDGHAVV